MVKHIHIQVDDDKHREMKKIKNQLNMSWEDLLIKGKNKVEG